ncbi:Interleukin-11 receptor subunit alpha-1, partial [Ophiophagus hannah]
MFPSPSNASRLRCVSRWSFNLFTAAALVSPSGATLVPGSLRSRHGIGTRDGQHLPAGLRGSCQDIQGLSSLAAEWGRLEEGGDPSAEGGAGQTSSTTRWQRHGGSELPSDSRVQQGQLLLSHVDLSSEGTYSCQDGAGLPLGSVALRVGRLPGPPSVSCRASNYENFSCFWTPSVETHLPTRYITSYLSPVKSVGPCVQDPSRPLACTVSKSQFWSLYRVNVTEVNPLGSSFTLLNIIAQRIAKPDPPEHVRVEPVPQAPRRLRVSWEYPSSWRKELSFQLHFRLRYRPVLHNSWSMIETSNVSEVITDAVMGLEHTVQVSAKDYLDAGSWSEWSPEVRAWPAAGKGHHPERTGRGGQR